MPQAIPVMCKLRLSLVAALLLVLLFARPLLAAAQEAAANPYEVTGVQVDVTAENAPAARSKALADGARQALTMLIERYVPEDRRARFSRMPQDQIEDMISDFSIRNEKSSSVRYIATLDYRFKASRASRLLRSAGVTPPDVQGQPGQPASTDAPPPPKPIVVVPIFETGPGQAPGGGADPWRDAWQALAAGSGGRYVLATGDTAGIANDQARLTALVQRTGGDSALVAVATMRAGAEGAPASVEVRFLRQSASRTASGTQSYAPGEDEAPQAFFRRVAQATQSDANSAWRRAAPSQSADRSVIQVAVPVTSLAEWLKLQKQIRGVDGVRGLDVVLMSSREMLVRLSYNGSLGDLIRRLEDADFALSGDADHRVLARDTTPIEPAGSGGEPATP